MENAVIEAVSKAVNAMDEAQLRSLVTDAYVEVRENSRELATV